MSERKSEPPAPAAPETAPEWSVKLPFDRLCQISQNHDLRPTEAQRAAIAARLGLVALNDLHFYFNTYPITDRRARLTGVVEADYVQACVVTLEPLETHVREPVTVDLVEASDPTVEEAVEELLVELEDPEPIADGRLDAGELAVQIFATTLDLFPRKPGLEPQSFVFGEDDESAPAVPETVEGKPSPFAALAALKRDKGH